MRQLRQQQSSATCPTHQRSSIHKSSGFSSFATCGRSLESPCLQLASGKRQLATRTRLEPGETEHNCEIVSARETRSNTPASIWFLHFIVNRALSSPGIPASSITSVELLHSATPPASQSVSWRLDWPSGEFSLVAEKRAIKSHYKIILISNSLLVCEANDQSAAIIRWPDGLKGWKVCESLPERHLLDSFTFSFCFFSDAKPIRRNIRTRRDLDFCLSTQSGRLLRVPDL